MRDERGISPDRIAAFIVEFGNPTQLEGRFGERGKMLNGGYCLQHIVGPFFLDGSRHTAFLERDETWFPSAPGKDEP